MASSFHNGGTSRVENLLTVCPAGGLFESPDNPFDLNPPPDPASSDLFLGVSVCLPQGCFAIISFLRFRLLGTVHLKVFAFFLNMSCLIRHEIFSFLNFL